MAKRYAAEDDHGLSAGQLRQFHNAKAFLAAVNALSETHWQTAQDLLAKLANAGVQRDLRWIQLVLKYLTEGEASVERDQSCKPYRYRKFRDFGPETAGAKAASEALTLLLARAHLQDLLPVGVLQWMDDSFRRAEMVLTPEGAGRPYASWLEKVAVVSQLPSLVAPAVSEASLRLIGDALLNDRLLNIDYRNSTGRMLKNRQVMPLALVRQSERLFLVCRFQPYEDVRNLALHRLVRVEATPHSFMRPANFKLADYIADGGFGFGRGERVQLVMRVAPHLAALLRETPMSEDQVIEAQTESSACVTATVVKGEQIRWWIRMHGQAVQEVISPPGLMGSDDSARPARTEPK